MGLRDSALLAGATMACALVVLWPATTSAEEIADEERMPEYGDLGPIFDGISVTGELVADAKVPGGWVLVRTLVNTTDAPATCSFEERVMRQESQVDARVSGTPTTASATVRTVSLAPRETQKLQAALPVALGEAIRAGARARVAAEKAREHAWEQSPRGRAARAAYDRTFASYFVQYLKPLPAGATAKPPEYIQGPGRMPEAVF